MAAEDSCVRVRTAELVKVTVVNAQIVSALLNKLADISIRDLHMNGSSSSQRPFSENVTFSSRCIFDFY